MEHRHLQIRPACVLGLALLLIRVTLANTPEDEAPRGQLPHDVPVSTERLRLPERSRRTEGAPAAAHLPGHLLLATQRVAILTDLQRATILQDEGETSKTIYTPQAYLLYGRNIYAGVGVGTIYADRRVAPSPFVGLRTGLSLDLFHRWQIDISAQIHISDSNKDPRAMSDDPAADTLSIAGTLRWTF
jgi:hypothetical protein